MSSYFRKPNPIEVSITIEKDTIVETVVSILNKMAEARFDGQNTQYVNNMQPEVDFEQDEGLVSQYYDEGVANIEQKIEPYVKEEVALATQQTGQGQASTPAAGTVFQLVFPENWKMSQQRVLEKKMEQYLVCYIIWQWLEKVSMSDIEYNEKKAKDLLRGIKWACEIRKGVVHRVWNGTY